MLQSAIRLEKEANQNPNHINQRPTSRGILFDGVSKEGKGRNAYLKYRTKTSPTAKYSFPVTSAQEIGWRCEGKEVPKSNYGRSKIVQLSFFRKSGVFYEN